MINQQQVVQNQGRSVRNRVPLTRIPTSYPGKSLGISIYDYLLAFGMWLWCAATFLPVIVSQPEFVAEGIAATDNFRFVPFAGAAMIALDAIAHERLWTALKSYQNHDWLRLWLVAGISFLLAVFGMILGLWQSVLYAGVLLFTAVHIAMIWALPIPVRTAFFRALIGLLVFTAVVPLVLYGLPVNRWVGGIHPNVYGAFLVGIVIFSTLAFPKWGELAIPLGLAGALLVSSRYTMVTIAVFAVAHVAFNPRIPRAAKWTMAYLSSGLVLVPQVWNLISTALLLQDADRGIASGVSGRADLWLSFWPQFVTSPLIGFGFRSRSNYESVHNAYLGLLIENGLFVGTFIIIAILVQAAMACFSIIRGTRNMAVLACFCGIPAVAAGAFFQPQIINFGDPMGLSFLFLMFCPIAVAPERASLTPRVRGRTGLLKQGGLQSPTAAQIARMAARRVGR